MVLCSDHHLFPPSLKLFGFVNWVDYVNWPPSRDSKAFESLYGDQFTLSTQLTKPKKTIYLVILPTNAAPQFL